MNKLKVMIVDDERIIRFGIVSMVNWEALGLEVVCEASNGEEGYEAFLEKEPDIVITDIKMPVMDGIEMIRRIQKDGANVKYIILSGYEDFSYAKSAIRLGVSEYLLKSDLMPDDIESILSKIVTRIRCEQGIQTDVPETVRAAELKNTMYEACHGLRTLDGKEGAEHNYYCLYIGIKRNRIFDSREFSDVLTGIDQVLQENLDRDSFVRFKEGEMAIGLVVFGSPAVNERVRMILTAYMRSQPNADEQVMTIGCSSYHKGMQSAAGAFDEAGQAYRMRMFQGNGSFIMYQPEQQVQKQLHDKKADIKSVEQCFEYHDRRILEQSIQSIFSYLKEGRDYEETNMVALELLVLLNHLGGRLLSGDAGIEKKRNLYQELLHLDYIEDIESWFLQEFTALFEECQNKTSDKGQLAQMLKQYIDEHYAEDITLYSLGNMVGLNRNYVSIVFKKEIGKGPIEYLTNTRIGVAERLLLHTDMKAKEVAEKVGYEDERYFYKVFKRVTGYTAMDYIKKYKNDTGDAG